MSVPETIPIRIMADLHSAIIGRCADGTQFFLNQFHEGSTEVLVLYRFEADGRYLDHVVRRTDRTQSEAATTELLSKLENPEFCDIAVRPFCVSVDGESYGLLVDTEDECVHLQPHTQITFMEPWDGEYYT